MGFSDKAAIVILIAAGAWSELALAQTPRSAVAVEFRLAEPIAREGLTKAAVTTDPSRLVYLHQEVLITNEDVIKAEAVEDPRCHCGMFRVEFTFSKAAAARLAAATRRASGLFLAIIIDGKVVSAPAINGVISDTANVSILTKEEAERITRAFSGPGPQASSPSITPNQAMHRSGGWPAYCLALSLC